MEWKEVVLIRGFETEGNAAFAGIEARDLINQLGVALVWSLARIAGQGIKKIMVNPSEND
jgi:hypothetical protein